jgi:hypothetical protein
LAAATGVLRAAPDCTGRKAAAVLTSSAIGKGVQLIGRLGAGLHRRSAGQPQGSNHLDVTIAGLGLPDHGAGLHRSCCRLGIDRVGLAASPPCLSVVTVRALDSFDVFGIVVSAVAGVGLVLLGILLWRYEGRINRAPPNDR